jgi:hypothetical protein
VCRKLQGHGTLTKTVNAGGYITVTQKGDGPIGYGRLSHKRVRILHAFSATSSMSGAGI